MPEGSGETADEGESAPSGPSSADDGPSESNDPAGSAGAAAGTTAPSGSDDAASAPDAAADRRGVHNLVRALEVPRQAKRGFAVGVLLAAATYWFFVVASGGSPYSTPYLLSLAAVLAFTAGLLATLVFTVVAAYRLSQRLA